MTPQRVDGPRAIDIDYRFKMMCAGSPNLTQKKKPSHANIGRERERETNAHTYMHIFG